MAKTIIYDSEVVSKIEEIAEYIEETFGRSAAIKFTAMIEKKVDSLLLFPEKGRRSKKIPDIHFIKVSKFNRVYYRIDGDDILILYLFDMRQAPEKDPYQ